jgi:hypothetical protein
VAIFVDFSGARDCFSSARLVAQGYSQVEDQDFVKTFAPISHLEAIMNLLAFAASRNSNSIKWM